MKSNITVRSMHDRKLLERYVKDLKRRSMAMVRFVLHRVARRALNEIVSRIPNDPDLDDYGKQLGVYMVKGKEIAFAILHSGQVPSKKLGDLDAETTVLYIKPIVRGKSKNAKVYRAMEMFSPFTLSTWPGVMPKDKAFVVYREVRKDEVNRVRRRNLKEQHKIRKVLEQNGVKVKKEDFEIKDVLAVRDLTFRILRRELGIGMRKLPAWRPGIEAAKQEPAKIMERDEVLRTLLDPSYRGWHNLGRARNKVNPKDLEDIQEFQDKVLG